MLTLSAAAIVEKNKVASTGAWLILLEFDFDGRVVRLVNNTESVEWDGETWIAFPFKLDVVSENNEGEIPTVTISVSNQSQALQSYIEQSQGGVNTTVVLRVVHSAHLDQPVSEIEERFTVLSSRCTEDWATFVLGGPYPTRVRFPPRRYMTSFCSWEFKGVECGYSGPHETCTHTLADCRARNNSKRFGGFPGIAVGGIYV